MLVGSPDGSEVGGEDSVAVGNSVGSKDGTAVGSGTG